MGNATSSSNRSSRRETPEFRGASAFEGTPSVVESVTSVVTAKTTPPARDEHSSSVEDDDSTVSTASCSRTGSSSTSSNGHLQLLKTDDATKTTKSTKAVAPVTTATSASTSTAKAKATTAVTTRARKRKRGFESSSDAPDVGKKPSPGPQTETNSNTGKPIAKRACSLEKNKAMPKTIREEPEISCRGRQKLTTRSMRLRQRTCNAVRGIQAQEGKSSRWCWNLTEDETSSTSSGMTHSQAESIKGCSSDAATKETKHNVEKEGEMVARENEKDQESDVTDCEDAKPTKRYTRVGPVVDDKTPFHLICDGDGGEILAEDRPVYYDHEKWHKSFKYLRKHLRKHNVIRMDTPLQFRKWAERQQALYQKDMLLEKRKAKLNSIGFDWKKPVRFRWEEMFDRFKAYRKRYKSDSPPTNSKLFTWIMSNRSNAKGRKDNRVLSDERRAKLEAIGFQFTAQRRRSNWDDMFRLLVAYQKKHNTLVVSPHDSPLGKFVKLVRRSHKQGRLEKYRVDALNSIGFEWGPKDSPDFAWNKMFDRFVAYQKSHPLGDVPMDLELERWVRTQRRRRLSESETCRLSYKRASILDSVGFPWEGPKKRIGNRRIT